jgi:hypothetical protein
MSVRTHSPISLTGILAMLERMDLKQNDRQSGSFYVEPGIEAQCLIFLTSNHKVCFVFAGFAFIQKLHPCYSQSILVLPHALVHHAPKMVMMKFLQARWHEHVAESHLLRPCGQREGQQQQLSLLKHRQERAELEASLYSAARTPFLSEYILQIARCTLFTN